MTLLSPLNMDSLQKLQEYGLSLMLLSIDMQNTIKEIKNEIAEFQKRDAELQADDDRHEETMADEDDEHDRWVQSEESRALEG